MKKITCSAILAICCVWLTACADQTIKPVESSTAETMMVSEEQPERVFALSLKKQNEDAFMAGVMKAFTDSNAIFATSECATEEECREKLLQACEEGYEYIVGAEPVIADMIAEVASEYPNTEFAIYDAEVSLSNVTGFYVDRTDAYYETGVIAAKMTKEKEIQGINEEMTIGWIGGMNLPIVKIEFTAFEEGAKSVEPEIQVLERYTGSWNDPEEGKRLASEIFELGADVIVCVADESNRGVLEAAEELGFYVIDTSGKMESSEFVAATITDDMEQIGYHMIKKMLNGSGKEVASVELTMEDGCVVLDKESKAY